MLKETMKMYDGTEIPVLGYGTWQIPEDIAARCVREALETGYRHIDTAAAYGNEHGVGEGIKMSGLKREEVFITSKVPAEIKTYEGAKASIEKSLELLDVDQIDLMLIHAPRPWKEMAPNNEKRYYEENVQVYRALEEAYQAGKLKTIGVSNFDPVDLQNIFGHCTVKPMVNQILVHIGNVPQETIDFCRENDIVVESFSPNATGQLKNCEAVTQMAEKYKVTVPQLGIRFDYQLGTVPLPKTTHREYMEENAALDFVISEEDMKQLLEVRFTRRRG